ncbi:aminotransferase class I/II-fold pyridoxal phosphate-dependent enzyme [Mycoplasmatota bacterium]|nr:aminotransferase class I/II-fold pyridoxal phosphate-dependent enzyme [Mycoplasmatota bacterium]
MKLDQNKAPIYLALKKLIEDDTIPFDVPGHKRGRGNALLQEFIGSRTCEYDVNSSKTIDYAMHPTGVIREAEKLMAEAFGADDAFLMVNGTTSAVQAMVMAACMEGEKIILPRNVHKSAINALILSGAIPVYINPGVNHKFGISLGISVLDVKQTIEENPDAKAIFIINPTYYGICSNIKEIVKIAHEYEMLVLVDEAHGTHLYFGENSPCGGMQLGADMCALSLHKTGGSLTQSSVLLVRNEKINPHYVRNIINITLTTSSSYLLLTSLDLARKQLVEKGKEMVNRATELANYARNEIEKIGGYIVFSRELINGDTIFDYDVTKLSINVSNIGLSGFEMGSILRDEYHILIEYGDANNFMCIISLGDTIENIDKLVAALKDIKGKYQSDKKKGAKAEFILPEVSISPREAFYARKMPVLFTESEGFVSGEFVMCYPPGIPVIAPGEVISKDAIEYIIYSKEKGSLITGPEDLTNEFINILVY